MYYGEYGKSLDSRIVSLKLVVVVRCPLPSPFLGLQRLLKLAQTFCTSQIFKVHDRFIRAMSGLDPRVNAVNEKMKLQPYLAGLVV